MGFDKIVEQQKKQNKQTTNKLIKSRRRKKKQKNKRNCDETLDVPKMENGEWGMGFWTYIDVEMPHLSYMWTGLCRFNI